MKKKTQILSLTPSTIAHIHKLAAIRETTMSDMVAAWVDASWTHTQHIVRDADATILDELTYYTDDINEMLS